MGRKKRREWELGRPHLACSFLLRLTAEERAASPNTSSPTSPRTGLIALWGPVQGNGGTSYCGR